MSLKRNTIWNLIGTGSPFLIGIFAIPYLYHQLGPEKTGVLTLIWALIGYFNLFDFGFGRALTQQVAINLVHERRDLLPGLIKIGLFSTVLTGLSGGILFASLAYPLAMTWLRLSEAVQLSTAHALLIAAFGIPLTTITSGLRGVLEGFDEFPKVNVLRALLGAGNFGLPALSVSLFGPSLTFVIASLIAARFILLIAHVWLVAKKLPQKWLDVSPDRQDFKKLIGFGTWITVSSIVSPLMATADRFFVSGIVGAGVVAFYTVPAEALMRVLVLPGAITTALFPRFSALLSTDPIAAKILYRKSLVVVSMLMIPVCVLITLGSYQGLTLWLGSDFAENAWRITVVMAIGAMFNGVAFVPFALLQAGGHAKTVAKIHLFELVLYLPLLIIGLKTFGLIAAPIAWSARVALDLALLLTFASSRGFGGRAS